MNQKFQSYLAAFISTTVFIFVIISTENPIAIGATLSLLLILFSTLSGDGLNPAVCIALASMGKIPVNDVLPFIFAQVMGGLVAVQLFKRVKN